MQSVANPVHAANNQQAGFMKIFFKVIFLLFALLAGEAMAATCTSKANGNWNSAATWNCTSGTTPANGDTVILASPYSVSLNNNDRTAASLTINAGATLNDDGRDLTITGSVVINGTYDGSGNNGKLIMTGSGNTLTVNWSVIFKPAFRGSVNTFQHVIDDLGAEAGWNMVGKWSVSGDTT